MGGYGLVIQAKGTGLSASTVDIPVLPGIPDRCVEVSRVVVENLTSNGTVARIGIKRSGNFITLDYKAAFNANIPQVSSQLELSIYELEQLVVRVTGTTTGDEINVNVVYDVDILHPYP